MTQHVSKAAGSNPFITGGDAFSHREIIDDDMINVLVGVVAEPSIHLTLCVTNEGLISVPLPASTAVIDHMSRDCG